ncbi:GntR family transcriptional regulator [Kribbella sp. NPDC050820]|uniref:GntR family transcriptional regulator n=1 Tax=Kribbella sp. NPDC050820 TaxID=3155408 RepID=UPI0034003B4C
MTKPVANLESPFDRSTPLPLYYQLKQWLSARIVSGELQPGEQIPSELELCERFGISRGVVRQALNELQYEGLIDRERGRGTFVSGPKTAEGLISGLRGLAEDAASRGQSIDSRVLVLREVPASASVASALELAEGDPVVELERVRSLDGEPHVLALTYLPAALVPGLADRDLSGSESLYRILREDYGLVNVSSRRRVEASVAGAREAELLGVEPGAPLLVLRSVGYAPGQRPLDYFMAYHRGDRSSFEVVLTSPEGTAASFAQLPVTDDRDRR